MTNSMIDIYQWRYAVKKYDTTRQISDADLQTILHAASLAPSSTNIQPWKFVVVTDPSVRQRLRAAAWDQAQVTDASHLIVLARRTVIDETYIDHIIDYSASERGIPVSEMAGLKGMMMGVAGRPESDKASWAARQVYIALGFMLSTAASMHIDATPMEGFDNAQFDQILGLDSQGLASAVICTLGYRADDDKYSHMKKVRLPMSETVIHA